MGTGHDLTAADRKRGGSASLWRMTPEQRKDRARAAALARWGRTGTAGKPEAAPEAPSTPGEDPIAPHGLSTDPGKPPEAVPGNADQSRKHHNLRLEKIRRARSKRRREKPTGIVKIQAIEKLYATAIEEGNFGPLNAHRARKSSRRDAIHDMVLSAVEDNGILIEESTIDAEGRVVSVKLALNPALGAEDKLAKSLGITADALRITPKSRGEGRRDDALAEWLARGKMLRESVGEITVYAEPAPLTLPGSDEIAEAVEVE